MTTLPILESLGKFDRRVAEALFAVHPEWLDFASAEEDFGENALVVSVPTPNSRIDGPMVVSTESEQVTVFFDHYHCHFPELDDDVLPLIADIASGRVCVVSYWRNDDWCGTALCPSDELPDTNDEYPYANRILIRSWFGDHDKDLTCVATG